MTVNGHFQHAGGAFWPNFEPLETSMSHRRSPFAILREIFANIQSSHRDLCIDTLLVFTASRVLRLHLSDLCLTPPTRADAGCLLYSNLALTIVGGTL